MIREIAYSLLTMDRRDRTETARQRGFSAGEHGASINVEDLAGDEPSVRSAKKEDGAGNFVDVSGAAERDQRHRFLGRGRVSKGSGGHLGRDPARGDAVGENTLWGKLRRQRFRERDEGALRGGVVGMEGLTALCGGRGDKDDMASRDAGDLRAGEHVRDGGLDKAEDALQINSKGRYPLIVGHGSNGLVMGWPDAVIDDEDVEIVESINGGVDEGSAIRGRGKGLLERAAERRTAKLAGEGVSLRSRCVVGEGDAGACLAEEPNGSGADATGAAGDESGAAVQREKRLASGRIDWS